MATPVKMVALTSGLTPALSLSLSDQALRYTKLEVPKFWAARKRISSIAGYDWFGLTWADSYLWFQDQGISAFTMNSLKGKTIPMWVTDEDGSLRAKNPKIEQRTREDGTQQVLIFRKATKPGAPGRISKRLPNGQIAPGNVGVKWRHPGLEPRNFLLHGIMRAAMESQTSIHRIVLVDEDGHQSDL